MRIFVNAQSAFFGGGLEYLKNQITALRDTHEDVYLIIWTNSRNYDELSSFIGSKKTEYVKSPYMPYYFRFAFEQLLCPVLSKKYRADIVYMPGNVACFLTLRKQVLVFQNPNLFFDVVKPKNIIYYIKRLFQRFVARVSILRADRIIFISKNLKNKAIRVKHPFIHILYSGVNTETEYERFDTERFKPYILAVSNITYHKNYPKLLEAFEILHTKHPNLNLVIAGKIMDEKYYDKITRPFKHKPVWENIHFLGGVRHKYLKDLYSNALCYVTTTLLEAFPLTPFEAMSSGVPVVSSWASSLPEICEDAALYVNPYSPEDISHKIETLLNNKILRNSLIYKGKRRIKDFSWKKHADNLYKILSS